MWASEVVVLTSCMHCSASQHLGHALRNHWLYTWSINSVRGSNHHSNYPSGRFRSWDGRHWGIGVVYKAGWMGLKSTPTTWRRVSTSRFVDGGGMEAIRLLLGFRRLEIVSLPWRRVGSRNIPNSTAQIPVPVPASRTRFRGLSFPAGHTNSWLL